MVLTRPKITTGDVNDAIRRQSVMGLRDPPTGSEVKIADLPKSVQERFAKSGIPEDEFLQMLYFAKYQPRGKRKLNQKDLSDMVVGFSEAPLTKEAGLRSGGKVAMTILEGSIEPLKTVAKPTNLMNKNRIATNPNFTSFKNVLKI